MILFWSIGVALAALALWLVLRPLLAHRPGGSVSRRDANIAILRDQRRELDADLAAGKLEQPDYESARTELEARLLQDVDAPAEDAPRRAGRGAAALVGIAIPLCALGVYLTVGAPGTIVAPPAQQAGAGHGVDARQVEAMVEALAARLRTEPGNAQGWAMLGRSYAALRRFQQAVSAYAKAAELSPNDARLFADYADALAMTQGQSLEGEPEKLVLRALQIDPANLKALALAGTVAFERKDFKAAVDYWQRMLALVPPDSEDARAIRVNVAEAMQLAGGVAADPRGAVPRAAVPQAAIPPAGVRGSVRISPELQGKFAPEDTVFIYARAAEGPPMPLAVLRRRARELPADFALDDSMAMAPGMNLSAHARVVITARVSKSGKATPQPGDLQGASVPVANDAGGVTVVIDSVVR